MGTIAERFHALFAGLARVHGHFIPGIKPQPGEKWEKKLAVTRKTGPTVELWEKHLAGKYGLGVVPIREDNTCVWGAIDIDVYDIDLNTLRQQVVDMGLPLLVTRTKSGGAHCICFMTEGVPAQLLRAKLLQWALALGCSPTVEIFPKQDFVHGEDFGNWLNMPYYGGEYSQRYGIGPDGALSPEEYLHAAAAIAVSLEGLQAVPTPMAVHAVAARQPAAPSAPTGPLDWQQAPPCLELLTPKGFQGGTGRNNALFNLGVLFRKFDPENWEEQVREANQRYMNPPLKIGEVNATIKSLQKKQYSYKCNDVPIQAVCNRDLCLTRAYGIKRKRELGFKATRVVRIDTNPLVWEVYVEETRIACSSEQLHNQNMFSIRCMEELGRIPPSLKKEDWRELVNEWLSVAEHVEVPVDATPQGQILVFLDRYCTDKSQARQEDEMLLGKPYSNGDGHTYFQSADFLKYLRSQGIPNVKASDVFLILKQERGAKAEMRELKGKRIRIWGVLTQSRQTAPFEPPRMQKEQEF